MDNFSRLPWDSFEIVFHDMTLKPVPPPHMCKKDYLQGYLYDMLKPKKVSIPAFSCHCKLAKNWEVGKLIELPKERNQTR